MLDNGVAEEALGILNPDDFFDPRNQTVCRAMKRLYAAGKPIEPIAILDEIKTAGEADSGVNALYLLQLDQACAASGGVPNQAGIVREKARLREAGRLATDALARISSGTERADDVLSVIAAGVERMAANAPRRVFMSAHEFMSRPLPPVERLWDPHITAGIAVLLADPKVGKSRFATKFAGHVATGTDLFGFPVAQGRVLYIDRDESEDELQERLLSTWFPRDAAERIDIDFDFPRLDQGGLAAMDRWVRDHEDARLIVFDTWAAVRPATKGKKDAYSEENEALAPLKEWTRKNPRITVLLIHHTSKKGSKQDTLVHAGSGSLALPAAASCNMMMRKRGDQVILSGEGRRVRRFEMVLEGVGSDWKCLGEPGEVDMSDARATIVGALRDGGPMAPKQISEVTGRNVSTIRNLLPKLLRSGHIARRGAGIYEATGTGTPIDRIDGVDS